jgi:hypothetical protein
MSLSTLSPRRTMSRPLPLERRSAPRLRCLRETFCQPIMTGKDESAPGILEDISSGGLRIGLRRCFEPGRILAVSWRTADGTKNTLFAYVVHATSEGRGNWVVGCALMNPLTPEEVQAMA